MRRRGSVSSKEDADTWVVGRIPTCKQGGPDRGSGVYSKGGAAGEDCGGSKAVAMLVRPQFFVAVPLGAARDAGGGKVPLALLLKSQCLLLAPTNPARDVGQAVQGGRRSCRGMHRIHGGRVIGGGREKGSTARASRLTTCAMGGEGGGRKGRRGHGQQRETTREQRNEWGGNDGPHKSFLFPHASV